METSEAHAVPLLIAQASSLPAMQKPPHAVPSKMRRVVSMSLPQVWKRWMSLVVAVKTNQMSSNPSRPTQDPS